MYITDSNGNYVPVTTIKGEDGKEVSIRTSSGYIQWKREDTDWTNLIALDTLMGPSGKKVLLNAVGYILQYKYDGDAEWITLCDLSTYFGNTAAATAAAAANAAADRANAAAALCEDVAAGSIPSHASSHGTGGSDPITPDSIGAQAAIKLSGMLKGNGSSVVAATPNSDYVSPSGVTNFTNTTASTSTTTGAVTVAGGMGVAGDVYANRLFGAVWNDYAEYRKSLCEVKPGDVVVESGYGEVTKSSKRLDSCGMVVSDTYGFCIGHTNPDDVPIAVSGRVLVNVDGNRNDYHIGDVLCTGKNGKASKMKWYELILFPHKAIGIVTSVPKQRYWGEVEIRDRVWMKVV